MLKSSELRKLIRAHNILSKIVIPKGSSRDDLIKLIESAGYSVDEEKKVIKGKVKKGKQITLAKAKEITKPKPLTEEQKKKRQQSKQKKAGEKAFLKTAIPKPPPVSKQSKGIKVGKPPPKSKPKTNSPTDKKLKEYEKDVEDNFDDQKKLNKIRDNIFSRVLEPYLQGSRLKPVQDYIYEQRSKEPIIISFKELVGKIDKQIKGLINKQPKKQSKPAPKTKSPTESQRVIEFKKKQEQKKAEQKKAEQKKAEQKTQPNQRDKLNIQFFKDNNVLNPKLRELYNPSIKKQSPAFLKIYNKILTEIAKYRSKSGGQSYTSERKRLKGFSGRIAWFNDWIKGDDSFKKWLSQYEKYSFTGGDNIIPYLKSLL